MAELTSERRLASQEEPKFGVPYITKDLIYLYNVTYI